MGGAGNTAFTPAAARCQCHRSQAMAEREKPKRNSGYEETNPRPRPADGSKVPGTGSPQEHQNMPKDKPGKR